MEKVKSQSSLVNPTGSPALSLSEVAQQYIGQQCAVLCARYNYRGIMSAVGSDFIILAQARAVETSGASSLEEPQTEDIITSSIVISLGAIEIIYQPRWCFAPLDK